MKAREFITERKKKRKNTKRKYGGYFYPGFGYFSGEWSGDGSGGAEGLSEDDNVVKQVDIKTEVEKFKNWMIEKLGIKSPVTIELSMDSEEARKNHHTGGYFPGSEKIWVYAKNRNLVDILRTVAHELTHVKQNELGMIDSGDSYPGSPVESQADMIAGKWIKIYGKKNNYIFQ
jgi:hypothetical protein